MTKRARKRREGAFCGPLLFAVITLNPSAGITTPLPIPVGHMSTRGSLRSTHTWSRRHHRGSAPWHLARSTHRDSGLRLHGRSPSCFAHFSVGRITDRQTESARRVSRAVDSSSAGVKRRPARLVDG